MMATMSASMWFLPEHRVLWSSPSSFDHHQLTDVVGEGEVEEAGGLDLAPVGPAGPVTHKVHAELTLGRLDGCVGGAGGNLK